MSQKDFREVFEDYVTGRLKKGDGAKVNTEFTVDPNGEAFLTLVDEKGQRIAGKRGRMHFGIGTSPGYIGEFFENEVARPVMDRNRDRLI